MHKTILEQSIANVQKRAAEGDYPTTPAYSVEWLENMVIALATPPVVEEAVKAEGLDAETLERRLHLWFFRDVSDDQRHGLFKLCGYPVDEIGMCHSLQQRCLQHLVSAIRARSATP